MAACRKHDGERGIRQLQQTGVFSLVPWTIPQAKFLSCLGCARRRLLFILSTVQSTSRSASSAISRKIAAFALSGSARASWRYRAARARFLGSIGGTSETACEATAPGRGWDVGAVQPQGEVVSRLGCIGDDFSGSERLNSET